MKTWTEIHAAFLTEDAGVKKKDFTFVSVDLPGAVGSDSSGSVLAAYQCRWNWLAARY